MRRRLENLSWVLLSFFLAPYFYFRIWLRQEKISGKKTPKILVIHKGKIGDLVCTTLVFREIKKKYPLSFIVALVNSYSKNIISNNPYIDKIITFSQEEDGFTGRLNLIRIVRKENFDWSISCGQDLTNTVIPFWGGIPCRVSSSSQHAIKSSKILSIFNTHNLGCPDNKLIFDHYLELLRFLDIKSSNKKIEVFVSKPSEKKVEEFLRLNHLSEKDFLIGMSPTAGNKLKEWEPEKWASLADKLVDRLGAKIIFVAGPSQKDKEIISIIQNKMRGKSFDAAGFFSLSEVVGFLKRLSIYVTAWSGTMHIADALTIPMVVIVGPCNLQSQPPISGKNITIWRPLYCYPCLSFWVTPRFCPEGHHRCIKETTIEEVYQAAVKVIDKESV